MTGFGQASGQSGGRRVAVEIRGVNQRFLDVRLNLPREYQAWEDDLRRRVRERVERGKVDVAVLRSGGGGEPRVEVNLELARATVKGWREIQERLDLPGTIDLSLLADRTDLVRVSEVREADENDRALLESVLDRALRAFTRAREREGAALARDMKARTRRLVQIRKRLLGRTRKLAPELGKRLRERVAALLDGGKVAEERIVQETALLAERADVTEELVRLESHLERLTVLIAQPPPTGKAIDFLLQEIHREVNTIASKSNDLEVTNLTLEARGEIEKLREQAQNVE